MDLMTEVTWFATKFDLVVMMQELIDAKLSYVYEPAGITLKPLVSYPKFQLSCDGKYIVTVYEDKIQMIDHSTGKLFKSFNDADEVLSEGPLKDQEEDDNVYDKDTISNFVVGSDKNLLVTVSSDQLILKQWNLVQSTCVQTWKSTHKRLISTMAIDSTDTLLATGSSDKSIKVWDLKKRFYTHNLKTVIGLVNLLKFHSTPDHIWLISCHDDCNIRIWDLHSRSCIVQFESHTSPISSLDFLNDGLTMISFGKDSLINLWNINQLTNTKIIKYTDEIEFGQLVPSSVLKALNLDITQPYVLVCNSRGSLEIVQLDPMEVKLQVTVGPDTCSLKFFKWLNINECTCVVVTSDLDFLTINLLSKSIVYQFCGNLNEVVDLKCLPSSRLALATTAENIKIYHRGNPSDVVCEQMLYGHRGTVMSLDCSNNGNYLVSTSKDNSLRIWKKDSDKNCYFLWAVGTSHMHAVNCVSISKENPCIVVTGSEDTTVKKWLLSSVKNGVISPEWTCHAHRKGINCCAISPNNEIIATGSHDKLIILWSSKGKQLSQLSGHRRAVNAIAFSNKDQILVSGSTDGNIMIWSVSNPYSCLKTLEGHMCSVTAIKLFNNDSQIISSSSDGLIKIWCLESYKCLNTLDGHDDKVFSILNHSKLKKKPQMWCFDIDDEDKSIVSADASGIVIQWEDKTLEKYEENQQKKIQNTENEQTLQNLIKEGNHTDAIIYAIQLNKSRQVYHLFEKVIYPFMSTQECVEAVKNVLKQFDIDQITFLAKMVNEWNTHSKYFVVAHISDYKLSNSGLVILSLVLKSLIEVTSLDTLQNILHLESLISYTDRHLNRIEKQQEGSYLYELAYADQHSLYYRNRL